MTEERLALFLDFCRKNGFDITNGDSNQRKAVLGSRYSVLPAGAGSGKTTVLTYRFLRLLLDDEIETIHSDEILTITFTKAATANMRARIYLILKKAEKEGLVSGEELERFSNAEISTTDSFCSKIVRSDCTRYGISTSFRIEDESDYSDFIRSTLREIIEEKIESDEAVEKLCEVVSFDNLLSAFTTVADSYINIALPFTPDSEELYREMKDETLPLIERELTKKREPLEKKTGEFLKNFGGYSSVKQDTDYAASILAFLSDGTAVPEGASFSSKRSLKENPSEYESFKNTRKEIRDDYREYISYLGYTDENSFSLLRGYCSILTSFQERIILHKREEGALTFHDVMLLAIDILRTNPSLRSYYNTRFRRIMVDEFQDNNEENKRLIYLLAAKPEFRSSERYPEVDDIILDKVFMVGDEKQSIYRFRGADVSVFKNISRDFGEERVLALSENFRSESGLIDTINRIFSDRIMPRHSEDEYEAEYTRLESHRERVKSSVSFRYMNVRNIPDDMDRNLLATNALSEGYEVARIIHDEILGRERERYMVWDGAAKTLRYPGYDDIAILLRAGSNQSAFEKALRHFDIPFNVTDNKSLTMEAVMNDFYSILQYSVYGGDDRISYAAVLRSPFVNMSDRDIETVLRNMDGGEDEENNLSDDGKDRLLILEGLVNDIREKEKRESLTSLMHFLWFDCGYRYSIETERRNESYSEHFDYLFSIAADFDAGGKGLVELLDRIRPSLGDTSDFKDLNVLREEKRGVTIQTIHKSKGLEYPIVFVSDMAGVPKADSFRIATLPSGLPLFPCIQKEDGRMDNPVNRIRKEEDSRIENAETKRVLYVAATRSEHHLIFTSVFSFKAVSDDGTIREAKEDSRNSMLQYLVKGLNFDFETKTDVMDAREFGPVYRREFRERKKAEKKNTSLIDEWYAEPQQAKADDGRRKLGVTTLIAEDPVRPDEIIPLPSVKADRILQAVSGETDEEKQEAKEERITTFGTLVHLLLENSVRGGETDTSSFFPGDRDRETIIESAYDLRDNFISSPFRKTLEDYSLQSEKEFLIRDGSNTVEGIIDLLCVSPEKIIIVDYKTDSIRAPERHRAQLGYYRKALSTIYTDRTIETWLFYLRSGEAVKID